MEYLGGEDYVRGYSPTPDDNGKFKKYIEVDQLIYQSIQTQFTIFPRIDKSGIEIGLDGLFFFDPTGCQYPSLELSSSEP